MSVSLAKVTEALNAIAPLDGAEAWDNVGLLHAPSRPRRIKAALLTIDLTDAVFAEAVERRAELIVAYHPPIFSEVTRIGALKPAVVRAIERRIALYSPHTALDAAPGGVCDWLVAGLGAVDPVQPIHHHHERPAGETMKIVTFAPRDAADGLRAAMSEAGAGAIGDYDQCSFNLDGHGTFRGGESTHPAVGRRGRLERVAETRLEMVSSTGALPEALAALRRAHPYEEPPIEVYALQPRPRADAGPGRVATLAKPIARTTLIRRIKRYLGLRHVRLAAPASAMAGDKVKTIAVCPGAGGSLFKSLGGIDLYLTGEMRHHDVLAKTEAGAAVVLTDHTHTERGYLPTLRRRLRAAVDIDVHVARRDREPLDIV